MYNSPFSLWNFDWVWEIQGFLYFIGYIFPNENREIPISRENLWEIVEEKGVWVSLDPWNTPDCRGKSLNDISEEIHSNCSNPDFPYLFWTDRCEGDYLLKWTWRDPKGLSFCIGKGDHGMLLSTRDVVDIHVREPYGKYTLVTN